MEDWKYIPSEFTEMKTQNAAAILNEKQYRDKFETFLNANRYEDSETAKFLTMFAMIQEFIVNVHEINWEKLNFLLTGSFNTAWKNRAISTFNEYMQTRMELNGKHMEKIDEMRRLFLYWGSMIVISIENSVEFFNFKTELLADSIKVLSLFGNDGRN